LKQSDDVDRAKRATEIAIRLLSQWPDFGKATDPYVLGISEFLSTCTEDEIADLMHPRTGIRAKCKFLPTIADMSKVLIKAAALRLEEKSQAERREAETKARVEAALAAEGEERRQEAVAEIKKRKLLKAQETWPDAWIDWDQTDSHGNRGVLRSLNYGRSINGPTVTDQQILAASGAAPKQQSRDDVPWNLG
jgi:hypothetical protein